MLKYFASLEINNNNSVILPQNDIERDLGDSFLFLYSYAYRKYYILAMAIQMNRNKVELVIISDYTM